MLQRIFLLILIIFSSTSYAKGHFYERSDVKTFIDELVKNDGFNRKSLKKIFADVSSQPAILHLIQRPYEAMPWHIYRHHFITQARIDGGVAFWKKHQKVLAKIEKKYHVPAEYIVAILGVESNYGQRMSDYRVLDALSTLGFDYPPRSKFFRKELRLFLILAKSNRVSIDAYGSYAGAMGMPQFMPSAVTSYGVDEDGDGYIDLFRNPTDAIASIANYLHGHGWQMGQEFAVKATTKDKKYLDAIKLQNHRRRGKNYIPLYRIRTLSSRFHIRPTQPISDTTRATVIRLEQKKHDDVWLGLNNFYVITTYNISKNYAMVVHQLAEAIKRQYQA